MNAWMDEWRITAKMYYFFLSLCRNSRIFLLSFANIGDRIMWSALESKLKEGNDEENFFSNIFQTLLIYIFSSLCLSHAVYLFFSCLYILCRYNYKVNDVFREIMGVSGLSGCSGVEFSQSSRHKSKCNIL